MLSLVTGFGSLVGVLVLSGRKIVLKPLPLKGSGKGGQWPECRCADSPG